MKAEARPPSRFTRLSMLSNTATATLQKRYHFEYHFPIARDELLFDYDEETIDNEEFIISLKKNVSRKYKHFEEFDSEMDPVQCKAEF